MAILNIKLPCQNKSKHRWNIQNNDIKIFGTLCDARELRQLDNVLGIIPEEAIVDE